MAYILDSQITNKLSETFSADFSTYHSLTDLHMTDLAETLGVYNTADFDLADDGTMNSFAIREYLAAWFQARLFEDKMGVNNLDSMENEKYRILHGHYKSKADELKSDITREMIVGSVNDISDRVEFTNFLYRS